MSAPLPRPIVNPEGPVAGMKTSPFGQAATQRAFSQRWMLAQPDAQPVLTGLVQRTRATLLGANLKGAKVARTKLVEISGMNVGLVGVRVPLVAGKAPIVV